MENSNEEIKKEEVIDAEVFCGNCVGDMSTVEIPRNTPRLFTIRGYRTLVLRCNNCGKVSKPFTEKIKKI